MVLSKTPRGKWRCTSRFYLRGVCPGELFLEQRRCIEGLLQRRKTITKEDSAWGKGVWICCFAVVLFLVLKS